MSECVVRMEMPTKDRMCQIADDIDGVWYCPVMKKLCRQPDNGEMPSWCPIICQLPEGHGRLVDADSMEKDLNYDVELDAKALDDMSIVGYARERFQFDKNRKQDCIRYLSGQKTIVPAEVKRSET